MVISVLAWAPTTSLLHRTGFGHSIELTQRFMIAMTLHAVIGTLRRRDIRGHIAIGTIAAMAAVFATSRMLALPMSLTSLMATPIVALTCFGPGLAAGATTHDSRWLFHTAPQLPIRYRSAVGIAVIVVTVFPLLIITTLVGSITGALPVLLGQSAVSAGSVAGAAVIAARLAPWRGASPSAPVHGLLLAGIASLLLQTAVTRIDPEIGPAQVSIALLVAAFTACANSIISERAIP